VEVRGPEEAAAAARAALARSQIAVLKLALNADAGPTLSDEELLAICDAAHQADAIVTAHVQGAGQALRAVGAGVDEFAHTPWSERLDDDLVASIAGRMRIVSTLDIHSFGRDTPAIRTAIDNLRRFHAAGGTVIYGTDLGNGPIPAGIHSREVLLLRDAGLEPEEILYAMVRAPLDLDAPADLIALGRSPLDDPSAFDDLRLVVRAGRVVSAG
jgi:imidazolonepropionase-like amidohydrolase